MDSSEFITIPRAELRRLLNIEEQHNVVCAMFQIPPAKRGEEWVGKGITERIRTYLTSYVARRSVIEKETGAAFPNTPAPPITDPNA